MLIPLVGTRFERHEISDSLFDLHSRGYIRFREYRVSLCKGRGSINIGERLSGCQNEIAFSNRLTEDYIACPVCGNDYFFEELKDGSVLLKEITEINYEKIVKDIIKKIEEAKCRVININGNEHSYIIHVEDREYLLIFDSIYSDPGIIESQEGIININISNVLKKGTLPDTVINILGMNIVRDGFEVEKYKLRDLPPAKEIISKLTKISEVEKSILEKSKYLSWQAVENEFSNFFLNQIRVKTVELYKYRLLIETYPRLSYVPVNVAGAGKADKISIPLTDYLAEIFDGTFTVDAKCYTSTSVSSKTIESTQHHLSKDGFDARRTIIIATTNNITCWDDVIHYKSTTGHYRLIIFNARLIAEVSVQLNFSKELLTLIDKFVEIPQE
ncbi:hypothetical protein [Priestia aryabhattai]|uniref:hypothetical protein n=1 Tax=Priestia aryabhattai TaxID=412384 RepID=UPI0008DDE1C3|nr:hypothetical protein [Priestia aryabhattai]OHY73611.1 hypothetical protein BCV52_26175 [Priestia aryabhattai]